MNNNLNFGGIPVLLVGDFNQKTPIGQLATTSLLEWIKNKYEMKLQQEMDDILSDESNDDGFMNVTQYQKKRKRKNLNLMQYSSIIKKIVFQTTVLDVKFFLKQDGLSLQNLREVKMKFIMS